MLYREIKGVLILVSLLFVIKTCFKVEPKLEVRENVDFVVPSEALTIKYSPKIRTVLLPN